MTKTRAQFGFTLLEMLVAIAIFSIVSLMAVGASVNMFSVYGKTQTLQSAVDNLNFAMESLSRDIRFGTEYTGGGNNITVSFAESNGTDSTIGYYILTGRLYRSVSNNGGSVIATPVTSGKMEIETFFVSLDGQGGDNEHPRATVFLKGKFERGNIHSGFSIQTTVSQRDNDELETP